MSFADAYIYYTRLDECYHCLDIVPLDVLSTGYGRIGTLIFIDTLEMED